MLAVAAATHACDAPQTGDAGHGMRARRRVCQARLDCERIGALVEKQYGDLRGGAHMKRGGAREHNVALTMPLLACMRESLTLAPTRSTTWPAWVKH